MRQAIFPYLSIFCLILLSACGGSQSDTAQGTTSPAAGAGSTQSSPPVSSSEAARFLTQASFGPTEVEIASTAASGYANWINTQMTLSQTQILPRVDALGAALPSPNTNKPNGSQFSQAWWYAAANAPDQLRMRVSYALSQYFVVSFTGVDSARAVSAYWDLLGSHAFGNFRDLLEAVSTSPAMGQYLSHLRNQKENPKKGTNPDENYARELMQLFTIGLYQLNIDGSIKLDGNGEPIETYTNEDIAGLAKVFTGFSWAAPDTSDAFFHGWSEDRDPDRDIKPMQIYPQFHSLAEKKFLGTTIPAATSSGSGGNVQVAKDDLKIALDTLFNHPNVGPFFGKQLIQRLVTSNPSPYYVRRVASAFNDNGSGVRGDMKAVIRAVLLDAEARDANIAQGERYGKLREPVLRLSHWMRAFKASQSAAMAAPAFRINSWDVADLSQTPMSSPSVFNFYRPGYTPPGTAIAAQNLVAPEMQITNESSIPLYVNLMRRTINGGIGQWITGDKTAPVQPDYSAELALADTPDKLVDHLKLLLTANTMSAETRDTIIAAVDTIAVSTTNTTNAAAARANRVKLAIWLTMASADYLVQK